MMQARTQKLIRFFILFLLLITLIGVCFWWFRPKKTGFNAVPAQTAILLEFNSLSVLNAAKNTEDPSWRPLFESQLYETAQTDIDLIRKCLSAHAHVDSGTVLCAYTLQESDSLHGLWIFSANKLLDLASNFKQADPLIRWYPAIFQGCNLYAVTMPGNAKMVFADLDGFVLCARYSYLVEDAISQYRSSKNWWADQKQISTFAQTSPYKLFLRPEALSTREGIFTATRRKLPLWFKQHFKWIGFGLEGGKTIGYAETDGILPDSGSSNVSLSAVFSVIPDDAAFIARVGIKPETRFGTQDQESNDADFTNFIQPWLGNEIAFVVTEPFSKGLIDNQFLLLSIKDQTLMTQKLQAYGKARGIVKSEEYQTFTITSFLNQSLLAPFCGQSEAFRNPVFAVVGSYVVFGGSRSALEVWIDKYIVNQTIANQPDFLQLKSQLPGTGSAVCYFNLDCLPALWSELSGTVSPARSARPQIAGLLGLEAQSEGKQNLRLRLCVQPRGQASAKPGIFWKTPLNAPARTQPYLCFGADSTVHLLIQDTRNELYCLSPGGAIEWRLQLDGPLLSEIRSFDFFANGTACFILNTPDKIWILTEKGEAINRFPLPLQSHASNGLTLVDFDGNLKYSFFVACENKQVYGFDQYGRPLPGWNPQGGVGRVISPIVHFQYGNMDYLAMLDVSGKLAVYGRNGVLRFPALQLKGRFDLPLQLDTTGEKPMLVCFSRNGQVNRIDPEGKLTLAQTEAHLQGEIKAAITSASWENQGKAMYLLNNKTVQIARYGKGIVQPLFSNNIKDALDTLFLLPDQSVGALSKAEKKIFSIPSTAKAWQTPIQLEGSTPFTVLAAPFSGGTKLLFTGNGSFIYAYKL
ncbi:MAG: DUF3352 domain-containing protein [Bacteroidota bacterium]